MAWADTRPVVVIDGAASMTARANTVVERARLRRLVCIRVYVLKLGFD